jgi:hypothetical protein
MEEQFTIVTPFWLHTMGSLFDHYSTGQYWRSESVCYHWLCAPAHAEWDDRPARHTVHQSRYRHHRVTAAWTGAIAIVTFVAAVFAGVQRHPKPSRSDQPLSIDASAPTIRR